jgi:glutathione S-transferase
MPAFTLNVIKPSVNNMAARVFARAAGLDFAEHDVYGQTRSDEFLARNPAHLTPMIESNELPKGALWESSAIMQYLCNKHGLDQFYPKDAEQRATIDSALFYLVGTLYPYVARATYPKLNFPQYPGEVGHSDTNDACKETARQAAAAAIAEPLEVFHKFYMGGNPFIGGDTPSIADIRLASTLEFLDVIDYLFPTWVADYRAGMEKALGNAYGEPAEDVRSYVAYVRSQKS